MSRLSDLAEEGAEIGPWMPPKDALYRMDIQFFLPSMRGDIDGPIKRTIDAVFAGARRFYDKPWVNDGRIVTLHVEKFVQPDPGLAIHLGYLA